MNPLGSPYLLAHKAISDAYISKNGQPLNRKEVLESLETTQGLMFPRGKTLDMIIEKLKGFGLVEVFRPVGSAEEVIIPLERPKSQ